MFRGLNASWASIIIIGLESVSVSEDVIGASDDGPISEYLLGLWVTGRLNRTPTYKAQNLPLLSLLFKAPY